MTKSYMKSQLRKYKETHPWARKLPKSMIPKGRNRDDMPIDLGVLELEDEYGDAINAEAEKENGITKRRPRDTCGLLTSESGVARMLCRFLN